MSFSDSRKQRKVVVIGMGMVALTFIEALLSHEDEQTNGIYSTVTVIGEEPHVSYNRVGLTQYFSHRSVESLYLRPLTWYDGLEEGRLRYIKDECITDIDINARTIRSGKGLSLSYDVCVFSTGSRAAIPPYVSSHDMHSIDGIFTYRTVEDLERMMKYVDYQGVSQMAVVGGGLLGLEAAKALADMQPKAQVTIIERNKWILPRQLDMQGSQVLMDQLRTMGIESLLDTRVQCINTSLDASSQVRLSGLSFLDGTKRSFGLVVFAIGIVARDELAKATGLDVHEDGGIIVGDDLQTSAEGIFAIGECASWRGKTYGFIAPGNQMASTLAFNLTRDSSHTPRNMSVPDESTRLKMPGVQVASIGDYFADNKPLTDAVIPGHRKHSNSTKTGSVRALSYHDPFGPVYKKYLFSHDGKYLLGALMVGDINDYAKLVQIIKQGKPLAIPPGQLILGVPRKEGEFDGDDFNNDAQVCSCHNISKGDIAYAVAGGSQSIGDIKSKTKATTGCGGCTPLVTSIFNSEMKKLGNRITNNICPHFKRSRQDLFMIVKIKKLTTFDDVMKEAGVNPDSIGCEICKPAVASILSSLHNSFVLAPTHHQNQDTNDKFLANIQRNGTYSVIPRVPAGEITPAKLKALAVVAEKYGLYTKITGGQRIDLFGANKPDLPSIWEELGGAGFESGHAYGKALRTVKSCVGTSWCRFGVGDSVGLAVDLEERYKGIRAPHKFKGGVSGCVRECAEAQAKDFGVIATSKGWNVYIGGNGGSQPRHAELLATDVSRQKAIKYIDRFLMFYIQSADRLQRTARWVESLGENGQNGLEYLKRVIIDDSLGICKELDDAMQALVGTFFDEWAEVVRSPEKRALFRQFANTDEIKRGSEVIEERGQKRPADWPEEAKPLKFNLSDTQTGEWSWRALAKLQDLRPTDKGSTSMVVKYSDTQIAIFRLTNGHLYATQQMCPHRRAFVLADGLLGDTADGTPYVSCPLHKRNFKLTNGDCLTDDNYNIITFQVKENAGVIYLKLPDPSIMDSIIGTNKWLVRQQEDPSKHSPGTRRIQQVEIVAPTTDGEAKRTEPRSELKDPVIAGSCLSANKELEW